MFRGFGAAWSALSAAFWPADAQVVVADGLLTSCSGSSFQNHQAADVVGEVLKPDLDLRTHDADGADESPAGRILLGAEHVLDARPHLALPEVRLCLRIAQRTIASPTFVDAASEALRLQLPLDLGRTVGAVSVDVPRCIAPVQKLVELLTVMLARIATV